MAQRKVLDGKIARDARHQIEEILKSTKDMTAYKICKGAGVNTATLKRFRVGERITVEQLDKIGTWIVESGL